MNYVIAVGGTGAKCLEGLLHLCAVGLGPDDLYVLAIDPDASNGSVAQLKTVVNIYEKNREALALPSCPAFKTRLHRSKEFTWTPLASVGAGDKRFGGFLNYSLLTGDHQKLLRLLYTRKELSMDLTGGFRGHTSVGAAAMATMSLALSQDPWSDLFGRIRNDVGSGEQARIFILGSVFGGTGASGLPTLGAIIREEIQDNLENFSLGAGMILPYFRFDPADEDLRRMDQIGSLYARSEHFLLNTREALRYYRSLQERDQIPYDAVYVLGEKTPMRQRFTVAGPMQRNSAHHIELLAATAALDFFSGPRKDRCYYSSPSQEGYEQTGWEENHLSWRDLPLADNASRAEFKKRLAVFTTLGFAFLDFYRPLFLSARFRAKKQYSPWYIDHFERFNESLIDDNETKKQEDLQKYIKDCFFPWLIDIHGFMGVELINTEYLGRRDAATGTLSIVLQPNGFGDLVLPSVGLNSGGSSYARLWLKMCRRARHLEGKSMSKFLSLLYQATEEFCNSHYQLDRENDNESDFSS
jgi:hypothetical protein